MAIILKKYKCRECGDVFEVAVSSTTLEPKYIHTATDHFFTKHYHEYPECYGLADLIGMGYPNDGNKR